MQLSLQQMESGAQTKAVGERALDVGIGRNLLDRPMENVRLAKLYFHPLVLAIHATHALSGEAMLGVADLRGETFICSRPENGSTFHYNATMGLCWAAGFAPRVMFDVPEIATVIGMVASGLGVAVVPQALQTIAMKGVRYVPLRDAGASFDIYTMCEHPRPSVHALRFLDLLKELSLMEAQASGAGQNS